MTYHDPRQLPPEFPQPASSCSGAWPLSSRTRRRWRPSCSRKECRPCRQRCRRCYRSWRRCRERRGYEGLLLFNRLAIVDRYQVTKRVEVEVCMNRVIWGRKWSSFHRSRVRGYGYKQGPSSFVRTSQAVDASADESTDRMVPGVFLLAQVCRGLLGESVSTTGEGFRTEVS